MDEEEVREYVEFAQSIIDDSPQMGEATTKGAILTPRFLDLLSWEPARDTELEYSVDAYNKKYKADYALVPEATPLAFIEAKGVDTHLIDKHRNQLSAYLKDEDVDWGILTNAKEYEFYQRRVIDSKIEITKLASVDLQNLPERTTILGIFSKEAIQKGNSKKIADQINKLREAKSTLEAEKDTLANKITDVLTDAVSDAISPPAQSKVEGMIDELIEDIDKDIEDDEDAGSKNGDGPDPIIPEDAGEHIIKINERKGGTTLATFSDSIQKNVMGEAVNYLVEEHSLISELKPLPYVPGRKKAIINDEPRYPNGEEMKQYYELTGGYYVDTHASGKSKQKHTHKLADKCGLHAGFEGAW